MSGARDTSIHHRPATELVPDSVLDGMERDGWTPSQVRALIASYRLLARDVAELRHPPQNFSGRALSALCHLRAACDTSSRTAEVSVMSLSTVLQEMTEGRHERERRHEVAEDYERRHVFALVEAELREFSIHDVHLYPDCGGSVTQRRPSGGSLTTESSESLLGALEVLRRSRHG